jgi:energy-coupling factor transporter ATP-binding protein EcfA2
VIQVEITNFQAIDHLKLTVEGFTALVGRSNIGKSSVVRALKCALSGSSGSDFVRHDARLCPRLVGGAKTCKCFASVKLTFGEGQALLWEKGARGINRYTVWKDGVESIYDRVGQNIDLPEFLDGQFAPVKLGPNESLLQVSSQFDPPFLLDLSGPAVAGILSDIGQLDDINQALAAVAKDRRTAMSTRKVREADIADLSQRLVVYASLDDHLQRVRAAQEAGHVIEGVSGRAQLAERLITEVTDSARVLRRVSAAAAVKPPDPARFQAPAKRLGLAAAFISGWDSRVRAIQSLKAAVTPQLPDSRGLAELADRRRRVSTYEETLRERTGVVVRLEKATAARAPGNIAQLQSVALASRKVGGWLELLGLLRDVYAKGSRLQAAVLPDRGSLAGRHQRVTESSRLLSRLDRLERDLAQTQKSIDEATAEVAEVRGAFAELGLCPTCHQGIAPEHMVVHA